MEGVLTHALHNVAQGLKPFAPTDQEGINLIGAISPDYSSALENRQELPRRGTQTTIDRYEQGIGAHRPLTPK
jgi:hypothetical protein